MHAALKSAKKDTTGKNEGKKDEKKESAKTAGLKSGTDTSSGVTDGALSSIDKDKGLLRDAIKKKIISSATEKINAAIENNAAIEKDKAKCNILSTACESAFATKKSDGVSSTDGSTTKLPSPVTSPTSEIISADLMQSLSSIKGAHDELKKKLIICRFCDS